MNYSDYRDERRAQVAAQTRSNKKKKKKEGRGFKIFLGVYCIFLAALVVVLCIVLTSYLKEYERTQPNHIAANVVEQYASTDKLTTFLKKYTNTDSSFFEDPDSLLALYTEKVKGANVAYKENSEYRADAPSYDIVADNYLVGKIGLECSGTGAFNLKKWRLASVDIAPYIPETSSITILVPENAKVTVNDKEVSSDFITSTDIPDTLAVASKYVDGLPSLVTYTVSGLAKEPVVKAVDDAGSEMNFTVSESNYVAVSEPSQAFIDEVEPMVIRGIENWATYFIYNSFNLDAYILKGTDLYGSIFGDENYDRIDPWLYMWEDIKYYEFAEKWAGNYIRYNDKCFAVDVKYKLDMTFTKPGESDDDQKLDATWIWIWDDAAGEWFICDQIYH